ncbi:hypothetical protein [Streptomyces sp. NPDC059918]|uniref:hypothetical protein n=1 Tax=unclassified Streptomyces TaxID=2593676 RepID=UPI00365DDFBC
MHTPEPRPDETAPRAADRLYETARHEGAEAALTALHRSAGPHALVHGPAGHALAPAALLAGATHTGPPGALAPRRPGAERELTSPLLAALGLAAVRVDTAPRPAGAAWDAAVVRVRLGLTRRLLDATLDHLDGRAFGDTPLLRRQVVKTALAAVGVSLLEVESALTACRTPDRTGVRQLHDTLTAADGRLLQLLGAWGLTTDGPGGTAYVSQVLADAYAPPATPYPCEEAA